MAGKIMGDILKGKLALITGGGSGIGRAVCAAFGREGATVVVADIDSEAAAATANQLPGDAHSSFRVDVGDKRSVEGLLQSVAHKYGTSTDPVPLSVVVNCAGITRDGFLTKMDESSFDDVIRVNLKGTFLITQAASRVMIDGGVRSGSIVNISSIVGKAGNLGQTNYGASKAGVQGLTRSAAKELARYGIRCNAVLPGFIDTPMVTTIPKKVIDAMLANIPLGRLGQPDGNSCY